MSNIETYIKQFPKEIQFRLNTIRSIGFETFSEATERVYHGVPTFATGDKDILNYGAYKDHITIWIGYEMVDLLKNAYPQYKYTKVTIQFSNSEDFPVELVKEICEMAVSIDWR